MGEQALQGDPRQLNQLAQEVRRLVRLQTIAVHPAVDLDVHGCAGAGGAGALRKRLGELHRHQAGSQAVLQHQLGAIGRGVAHHQDGGGQPGLAQLDAFDGAVHCQQLGARFQGRARYLRGPMPVCIGLDHCDHLDPLAHVAFERLHVIGNRIQIDLGPGYNSIPHKQYSTFRVRPPQKQAFGAAL